MSSLAPTAPRHYNFAHNFPPFGTLLFEVWAVRSGRMAELSELEIAMVQRTTWEYGHD